MNTGKPTMTPTARARMLVRSASLVMSVYCLWGISSYLIAGNVYPHSIPFVVMLIATAATCVAAWRWERTAGLALILCGVLLGLASAYSIAALSLAQGDGVPPQAVFGLLWAVPFVIFGLLFRAVSAPSIRA